MSETIEAIATRLDPQRFVDDAKERSTDLARNTAEVAREFARELVAQVRRNGQV